MRAMPLVSAADARILLTTAPPGKAHELARALVEERLAACVNVVPGLRSIYRWEGALHDEPESLLIVKTTRDRLEALSARLAALHPYETPEVLVLTPDTGAAAYLAWLERETRRPIGEGAPPAPPGAFPRG